MLIRALVRFFWDESEYNHHWGGESLIFILSQPENPILNPPKLDEYLDEFYCAIEDNPYPETNKGISVYAGFYEGCRMMNNAIQGSIPNVLHAMTKRLGKENFFQVEGDLKTVISPFIHELEEVIPHDSVWLRARIGIKNKVLRMEELDHKVFWTPYCDQEISAPPPPIVNAGRLNRHGVSVLYLASSPETAVAEIRPHPGHLVSLGGFKANSEIKIANFSPSIRKFATSDDRLFLYSLIHAFDVMMSTPVTPENKNAYLLTQLLADILRENGFDGVKYRSSVAQGDNICIFHPKKFTYASNSGSVQKIDGLSYTTSSVRSVTSQNENDQIIH